MRAAIALLLALASTCAVAGLLPDKERGELIALVLENFWGKAKLPNGQFVQPSSEEERRAVPVSKQVAHRAIDAGEISGLGEWCRLDWKKHYVSFARSARAKGFTEKQVAFFAVLHGAAQGRIATAMQKGGTCSGADRTKIEKYLMQSMERGLAGT